MMRLLILSLLVIIPGFSLQAKPSQPIDTMLFIDGHEEIGDKIEYQVTFKCRPAVKIDKITFKLNLPTGFTLEQGFSYWEGEIKEKTLFTRSFKIRGPNDKKEKVTVISGLFMENYKGFKSTVIELSKDDAIKRSKVIDVKFGSENSRKGRNRNGTISRQ